VTDSLYGALSRKRNPGAMLKDRARASRATCITTHEEGTYETRNSRSFDHDIDCHISRSCAGWKRPWSSEGADHHRLAIDVSADESFIDAVVAESAQADIRVNDEVAAPRLGRTLAAGDATSRRAWRALGAGMFDPGGDGAL